MVKYLGFALLNQHQRKKRNVEKSRKIAKEKTKENRKKQNCKPIHTTSTTIELDLQAYIK